MAASETGTAGFDWARSPHWRALIRHILMAAAGDFESRHNGRSAPPTDQSNDRPGPRSRPDSSASNGDHGGTGPRPSSSGEPPSGERSGDAAGPRASSEVAAEHAEVWAIVQRAQGGEGEAFGQLYDRYVDSVYRFIYYRVNDRQLAEDFTSDTFMRALRRIADLNYQGRDIGAWLMTIARNIVFDHTKSARFRLELTTGESIERPDREPGPEAEVLSHLTNARLMEAVNALGDEQKECIVLRFMNGLSVAETAEVMGKNDGAIKALQHRAVKRLAASLAGEL